jgi:hypothetical protein
MKPKGQTTDNIKETDKKNDRTDFRFIVSKKTTKPQPERNQKKLKLRIKVKPKIKRKRGENRMETRNQIKAR